MDIKAHTEAEKRNAALDAVAAAETCTAAGCDRDPEFGVVYDHGYRFDTYATCSECVEAEVDLDATRVYHPDPATEPREIPVTGPEGPGLWDVRGGGFPDVRRSLGYLALPIALVAAVFAGALLGLAYVVAVMIGAVIGVTSMIVVDVINEVRSRRSRP